MNASLPRSPLNLNADVGESFGAWTLGSDAELLPHIDSANIACGFHAGDPGVMQQTVRLARDAGVEVGAHPAFPDLQGFGRRQMHIAGPELEALLIYQIGALQAIARAEGVRVSHVKPHGALSNMACADLDMARQVVSAIRRIDPTLLLLAPAHSCLVQAAEALAHPVRIEVFADRLYQDDGQLVPRSHPGAVLHRPADCVQHVLNMLEQAATVSATGVKRSTRIDSICVHGDGAHAVETAHTLRQALRQRGYALQGLDTPDASALHPRLS